MRNGDFTKHLENQQKHQVPRSVPTVTRHPRIPVDLLLGTPSLPQQTSVRPLPSTSRPCAVDQHHQGKPFIPVTTINMQTCRYRPTVPLVSPLSIPLSCPQSQTPDSMATSPRPVALGWRPTLLSPRWYQTFTAPQPNSAPRVQTAQHRFINPVHAKTPTFPR